MDPAYLSAFAALAGSTIGGLTSLATSWLTQHVQFRAQQLAHDITGREELYKDFIEEASKLYADAYEHDQAETSKLVNLYALVSRMRVLSSPRIVENADRVVRVIIKTYLAPNKTFRDIPEILDNDAMDPYESLATRAAKNCGGMDLRNSVWSRHCRISTDCIPALPDPWSLRSCGRNLCDCTPCWSRACLRCSGALAQRVSLRNERPDYNQQIVRSAEAEPLLNLVRPSPATRSHTASIPRAATSSSSATRLSTSGLLPQNTSPAPPLRGYLPTLGVDRIARQTALEDGAAGLQQIWTTMERRTMHTLNERLDETEFVRVQEVSAGDTLLHWSLEDFSDIVSKSTPSEERDATELPDEFVH